MDSPISFQSLCAAWQDDQALFAKVVAEGLEMGLCLPDLAAEFEVAESTVSRWASGMARPHPRIQALVVASLRKRIAAS